MPAYGGGTIDGTAQLVSGPPDADAQRRRDADQRLDPVRHDLPLGHGPAPKPANGGSVFDLAFNLNADAKSVRIKSPIIDVGAAGNLALTGTLRSPRAAGEFTATRGGVFSTYQRLFRIQDATVTFDPSQGIVPNLDLHATAHVDNPDPDSSRNAIGSADITVAVTGPGRQLHDPLLLVTAVLAGSDRGAARRSAGARLAELQPAAARRARCAGRRASPTCCCPPA